jgi:uncharacterized membrane protein
VSTTAPQAHTGRPVARWVSVLLGLLALAYPFVVYLGFDHFGPRGLALLFAGLALARALLARQLFWWAAAAGALLLSALSLWGNALMPLKLYPVLVNAVMGALFAVSLWRPPSAIERLARLREPDLPPAGVAYTRRVTQVWCVFFALNGSVALATAGWASDEVWLLYNGFLSYLLMGALMGAEWLVRRRVRARMATQVGHG